MEVNYENLLQQSNQIKNHIKSDIATKPGEILNWKENPNKWSVLEVISHLSRVYDTYFDNFEKAIDSAPEMSEYTKTPMQRTFLGRLSIYSMRPKGDKRKFKMKTFDFFQPVHSPEKTPETINIFLRNKDRFNDLIRKGRLKNLKGIKMPTALGEKMKFYVPECFEFILAHEERHMVQIEEVLEKANRD